MSKANDSSSGKEGFVPHGDESFHRLDHPPLASDLLRGVRAIARYVHGTCDKSAIRSMYHLTGSSRTRTIPIFKLGSMTCALKSGIRGSIWSQQRRAWGNMQEELVRLHILLSGILALLSKRDGRAASDQDEAELRAFLAEGAKTICRVIEMDGANDDRADMREAG